MASKKRSSRSSRRSSRGGSRGRRHGQLLRKRQVAPASEIARKIDSVKAQLKTLHGDLLKHQLGEDYGLMTEAIGAVARVANSLERKAREAFVAARRGEPLAD
jgi:hypothetical protein